MILLMLILTLTPYIMVHSQDATEVPEYRYSDLIRTMKERIADIGKYQFTDAMKIEEIDTAARNLLEDSWTLVREMEQVLCLIYTCKFYTPCSYDFAKVREIIDDGMKRQIYNELLHIYKIFELQATYEETAAQIEEGISSAFMWSRNLVSPGLLSRLDKRSIRHPTVDSILCGFTAKAFLEYTFSKTLDQLDSHGRTQDGVDVLFNGLVKCHCPENYTGKHCERCHKTSTILIDGKSKISEIEADRIDIWRE